MAQSEGRYDHAVHQAAVDKRQVSVNSRSLSGFFDFQTADLAAKDGAARAQRRTLS